MAAKRTTGAKPAPANGKASPGGVTDGALASQLRSLGFDDKRADLLVTACAEFAAIKPKDRMELTGAERRRAVMVVHKAAVRLRDSLDALPELEFIELAWMAGATRNGGDWPFYGEVVKLIESSNYLSTSEVYDQTGRRRNKVAWSLTATLEACAMKCRIPISRSERSKFMRACRLCFLASGLTMAPDSYVRQRTEYLRKYGGRNPWDAESAGG